MSKGYYYNVVNDSITAVPKTVMYHCYSQIAE